MSNFFGTLKSVLLQCERLAAQDALLLQNAALELGNKMDEEILTLLYNHEETRKHFFTKINDFYVFDKQKFAWVVNNRQFLPDSYTRFCNKIGLIDSREKFISTNGDVVLSFPYKDCLLEGGQTKDEQKRQEVMWNEILSPDEVDRLLEPKAFCNVRTIKAGTDSVETNLNDGNLLIKGNNLLALTSLKKAFAGKVKLIYIDPPYNTGNGANTFKYNDRFNHASWLAFIRCRLEITKTLLAENGVIFIHINDGEMHYLKVLCDEIFGRDQFCATLPRKTRSGKSDVPYKLSQDFDWMLVYTNAKSEDENVFQRTVERKYYQSSDFPNDEWRLTDLTTQRSTVERPNSDFTLINPRDKKKYPVSPDRCWSITKETKDEFFAKGKIVFPGDYDFLDIKTPYMRVFKSEEIAKKGKDFDQGYVSTDFLNVAMDTLLKSVTNQKGTDEIIKLFGEKAFPYPKPELLLKVIIEYCTQPGDIVLDYHAGSGTTLAVAHKMGRRWIGIEQMDYIETITLERLKKVLDGEPGGVSKSVNWHGGGSFVYCELAQLNAAVVERIGKAKTDKEQRKIWDNIQASGYYTYKLDSELADKEFDALSIEDKKTFLVNVLDKNLLYINYNEMDDTEFVLSEEDKEFSRKFYGK